MKTVYILCEVWSINELLTNLSFYFKGIQEETLALSYKMAEFLLRSQFSSVLWRNNIHSLYLRVSVKTFKIRSVLSFLMLYWTWNLLMTIFLGGRLFGVLVVFPYWKLLGPCVTVYLSNLYNILIPLWMVCN